MRESDNDAGDWFAPSTRYRDLPYDLPCCPVCGCVPEIIKRHNSKGGTRFPSLEIAVVCFSHSDGDQWFPSLFEAVNLWTLKAKLAVGDRRESLLSQDDQDDQDADADYWNNLRHPDAF